MNHPNKVGCTYLRDSGNFEGDILFIQNKQRRRNGGYSVNLDGGGAILSFDVERLFNRCGVLFIDGALGTECHISKSPQAERAANLVLVGVQLEASEWEIPTN